MGTYLCSLALIFGVSGVGIGIYQGASPIGQPTHVRMRSSLKRIGR